MAGLPKKIIARANEILEGFEQESMFAKDNEIRDASVSDIKESNGNGKKRDAMQSLQIPLFEIGDSELTKELKELDIDDLTPLQALNILSKLKKKVGK